MTDLQLGSLIVGGAIVGLVYAYNWWQERRYRQQAQKAFSRNHPDVLLETPKNMVRPGESRRMEPMIQAGESATAAPMPSVSVAEQETRQDPVWSVDDDLDDFVDPQAALAARTAMTHASSSPSVQPLVEDEAPEDEAVTTSMLDASLDFIAEIHAKQPIPAANVPTFPGAKRIVTLGLNDEEQWEVLMHTSRSRYHRLQVGLQLADRQGALTQEQLNAFCMGVQQFADEFDAVVTFPQRSGKLNTASELDEFCAGVDVLIGLNIMPISKPFPMEKVRMLAEKSGLARGPDGNFYYRSDSGRTLFTLANQNETPFGTTSEGLTLLFDVPRVAGGVSVFDYLADFAQSLSGALDGSLADDNGKLLTDASLINIRAQLGDIYARMDDRGIAAGSMAALRLFA